MLKLERDFDCDGKSAFDARPDSGTACPFPAGLHKLHVGPSNLDIKTKRVNDAFVQKTRNQQNTPEGSTGQYCGQAASKECPSVDRGAFTLARSGTHADT